MKAVFTHIPYPLPWNNKNFANAKKVVLDKKALQLKGDIETWQAEGWVGESHVHEYVMNSKGIELIQNLCNTQNNSFPVRIMKQMKSEKKNTEKQTNTQPPPNKHNHKKNKTKKPLQQQTQNHRTKTPVCNKEGTPVEIKNFKSTRIDNLYQRIWTELTEKNPLPN